MKVKSSFVIATKDIKPKNKLGKKCAKPVREKPLILLKSRVVQMGRRSTLLGKIQHHHNANYPPG